MTDSSPKALDRVNFGRIDAEKDQNLLDYFVSVGAAGKALTGKYLVLGRKGSGKSALFRYVASNAKGTVVELDLKDYVFTAHKALRDDAVVDAFKYAESWRFAFIIAMFSEGYSSMPLRLRWRGRRLIRKLGAGPDKAPLRAIFGWLARVREIKLPSIGGVVDFGGYSVDPKTAKPFEATTRQLIDQLQEVLVKAVKIRPITVLVDRLDDAWDGSEDSLKLIGGAARAARQLADDLQQDGTAPAIVFLRTDLWERIGFNDKNKFTQDTVTLDWNNNDLAQVIEERIRKTAGTPEGLGWETIFTPEKMRQGTSAQNYLLKRVMGRPRDIVAFAIFALEVASANGHSRIEKEDIYTAEARYSEHILDELRDEISEHVEDMEAVVNSLKALERRKTSLDAWDEAAIRHGINRSSLTKVRDLLFEASAVGVLRANQKTAYRFNDRSLKIEETGNLSVHPALLKELGILDA
ncbi:P-loop ATPase, Sll1717 family [Glutamicibacter sp. AGC46]